MPRENIFLAVLISIIVTDIKSQDRDPSRIRISPWDIKQFVRTMEPIWTYKTTARMENMCKVDRVRHVATVFVEFNRSYYYHGQRYATDLYGKITIHE